MSKTSRPPSFADRLNEMKAERHKAITAAEQQIDTEIEQRLSAPFEKLRRYIEHELTRTWSVTQRSLGALWLRTLAITLGVCIATWSSLWAVGQWQHRELQKNIDLILHSEQRIEESRHTLRQLEQQIEERRQTLRQLTQE